MKRGNTYPIVIQIPGVDLTGADWVRVTLKATGLGSLEKTENDILVTYDSTGSGVTSLTTHLTEEQSVSISSQYMDVDVNWMLGGNRGGIFPLKVEVTKTLLTEVVSDGDPSDE